eukprot:scaffold96958_cov39-Phaeocystis_antarctica.AAC.1
MKVWEGNAPRLQPTTHTRTHVQTPFTSLVQNKQLDPHPHPNPNPNPNPHQAWRRTSSWTLTLTHTLTPTPTLTRPGAEQAAGP